MKIHHRQEPQQIRFSFEIPTIKAKQRKRRLALESDFLVQFRCCARGCVSSAEKIASENQKSEKNLSTALVFWYAKEKFNEELDASAWERFG